MKASMVPEFLTWWLRYGDQFPGLDLESVVARIATSANDVAFPDEYFHQVCHHMWRALQPDKPAPPPPHPSPQDTE
jgi:hypothetical protein